MITKEKVKKEIDKMWAEVAKRRLEEFLSGKVRSIPGDEVFAKVWKRFYK